MRRCWFGLTLLPVACLAQAEDRIFDTHVHIWNGEQSVQEYLAQVESAGLKVTGFGGIHMAVRGELAQDEFVWTMRTVGIDNLLLGSDFPQLSLKQTIDALERLPLTDEEKRKIRWENANRLLGLDRAIVKR